MIIIVITIIVVIVIQPFSCLSNLIKAQYINAV